MRVGQCSGVAISLGFLAFIGEAAAALGATVPAKQPPPETVTKLIARLNAPTFRARQQASDQLEKLGGPVLPALRKAATASTEPEVKRRIEVVVVRIENALFKAEEKRWQTLDASRRSIKDRLNKILARTPALSDRQLAMAVYLLTMGRPPTAEEVTRARKEFAETNGRLASVLQLTRSLVRAKEFRTEVAAANGRVFKAQKDLATDKELAEKLQRLNGGAFQKLTNDVAASLTKVVKTDKPLVDLAYLLVLSRFPQASEAKVCLAYLKKKRNRSVAASDFFWSLMNTREFLMAQ
jgi:hypothetical protein